VYSGIGLILDEVHWPFSRVYDRVAMVFILGCLLFWRKEFQLSELAPYFSLRARRWWVVLFGGVALTLTLSLLVLPILLAQEGLVRSSRDLSTVIWKVIRFLPAALVISVLEESFFRMLLFRKMRTVLPIWIAATCSSLLYSAAHFIQPVKSFQYVEFNFFAGLTYLGAVFTRLQEPALLFPYLGLFLVGMTLCFVFIRTNSLALCIGMHSGWVLVMKAIHYSADLSPNNPLVDSVGRRFYLVSQPVVWVSILLVAGIIYWRAKPGEVAATV
jgi:membrane protease YdiL (CAAX protease family)